MERGVLHANVKKISERAAFEERPGKSEEVVSSFMGRIRNISLSKCISQFNSKLLCCPDNYF